MNTELILVLKGKDLRLSDAEVADIHCEADADGDGLISYEGMYIIG
jgi:Ca2+-binding EF-hand superfamily protein